MFKISYRNFNIIVVDNNSLPKDVNYLEKNYGSDIQLIRCNENLGFAGGNNAGIKISLQQNADFILIINNDTIVEPFFLEVLLRKFETADNAGIVAPQINYYYEPEKVWSAGGKISRIRGSGFALTDKLETEFERIDKSVSFVSGCCMLIKKEVFQNVGLFDENFFLYIEDTDFCYRVCNSGYKIFMTPDSKIFHKVGSSTKDSLATLPLYYSCRNRLYFAKKNFKNIYFFTALYVFVTMLMKSFVWIYKGEFKNITAVQIAIKDFFSGKMGKTNHNNIVDKT